MNRQITFAEAGSPRQDGSSRRIAVRVFELAEEQRDGLNALGERERVGLFTVLVAGMRILFARYGGHEDAVVSTSVAIAGADGTERHESLKTDPSGDCSAVEVLAQLRAVEERSVIRATMVVRNVFEPTVRSPSIEVSVEEAPAAGESEADLALSVSDVNGRIRGELRFDQNQIEPAFIHRLLGHYTTLLEGMAAAPDNRVGRLPMLTGQERQRILHDWNDTARPYPLDICLHQLFEDQADKTPDRTAVVFENDRLTYRELNDRSNRLAHFLQSLGAGPETRVAICVERSIAMLVGVLGILKAGAAYVPLDPAHPAERLSFMVQDAQAAVLLTRRELAASLPGCEAAVVDLDRDRIGIERQDGRNPSSAVSPANLAYVIYTSGSTGKPKGVAIEHRNAVAFVAWSHEVFSPQELAGVFACTSLGFDLSVFEMFVPLTCGGKVLLASNALALPSMPAANETTLINTVPSALAELIAQDAIPDSVKTVNLAGEPLPQRLVREIYRKTRTKRVYDLYGPSESTTYATYAHRTVEGPQTIGRPISNTRVYVLDGCLEPVPVGVAGELHIGGAGLARGYLHRPALTAERFITDPFQPGTDARLYKTGDRVRWMHDGNLEFLGRLDDQVKIRGFRIELGEIESALALLPDVQHSAVVAREEQSGEKRLVAYVAPVDPPRPPSPTALRAALRRRLPEYMVPSAFVFLDRLPLSPNGKIDRKALPAPAADRGGIESTYRAPRTPTEDRLTAIWSEVLGISSVGVDDNFFDLGGHSLLAMRIVSRIRQTWGMEFPLRAIFETPCIATLAETLDHKGTEWRAPDVPLAPAAREEPPPLSFAQQRLWFLDQYVPEKALYNIPCALRLSGPLDVDRLRRSLVRIVARHEVLRTSFEIRDDGPIQRVSPSTDVALPVVDLSDRADRNRAEEADRLAVEEARRPFHLAAAPPLRARLFRFSTLDHLLLLTVHHIAADGWSMDLLVEELREFYRSIGRGLDACLPCLPVQYADFAVWQRRWLTAERIERQVEYWKNQLAGAPELLELPTDRPRPAIQSFRGACASLDLSSELRAALYALCHAENATLFMVLTAGFQILLARQSGQYDVVVGTAVAGRDRPEIERLIGFFVNTLPIRTDLSEEPTVSEALARVRAATVAAFDHQDVPFEVLVERLQPPRSPAYAPIFQAMLVLQNPITAAADDSDLVIRARQAPHTGTSKFDLVLSLEEDAGTIHCHLEYNTDLFEHATIHRMLQRYEKLLEGMAAGPSRRIGQLPMHADDEKHLLLKGWNDTDRDYPRNRCVHQLFEDQVSRTPDAVAVVFEDHRLTYQELNVRANRLAHALRALGVDRGGRVALCVERSPEMIVGLLGILKAGGAYVPLDPSYPQSRLEFMLRDTAAPVVLTQASLISSLPQTGARLLVLDDDLGSDQPDGDLDPAVPVTADDLAYVMYTSGSTGTPKGVEVIHRAIARLLCGVDYVRLDGGRRILQMAPISFDASTFEIWGALLHGGCCVLFPDRTPSIERLGRVLDDQKIDTLWLTSALFNTVIDEAPEILSGVKQLLAGGDVLSVPHVKRALAELPDTQLINGYGPTETTTFACCYPIPRPFDENQRSVPIGRPINATRAYVLDGRLEPVPIGIAGELYLGGDGLARGYLNRPDLTDERFVPDPFRVRPGGLLYRTGDQVRWRTDGTLEFLGRLDNQVKIRGFRIELGEIESALARHPDLQRGVVIAHQEKTGAKRLVAYVVPGDRTRAPSPAALRNHLSRELPEYMIPSEFIFLDELPLGPNGKVDRNALPTPGKTRPDTRLAAVAPRTERERQVAAVWAEVLHLDEVGVHDNFFDLGGHSLLAARVVSRLGKLLDTELPVRALFEAPTVARLAERIDGPNSDPADSAGPPIVPVPRDGELPLSFAQQRLWFIDQLEPGRADYNIPFAIRLNGALELSALESSLDEIVRRHEILRTTYPVATGEPVQHIAPPDRVRLQVVDLAELPLEERERALRRTLATEAERPFRLDGDSLFRAGLVRLGPTEHVLFLIIHHIAADGGSIGVIVRELAALYPAFRLGKPSPLPDLPIQYADYAVWQRARMRGERLRSQLDFWQAHLAGAGGILSLPADRPRPATPSSRGGLYSSTIRAETTQRLAELAQARGATLFMTLFAAFGVLLSRLTGEDDLVVGIPVEGRNRVETEGLVGLFVNLLALRMNLSGNPSFGELVGRVRSVALDAFTHQDLPFEYLVESLRLPRELSHHPLVQVLFNMHESHQQSPRLPGNLELRPEAIPLHQSKFDLTLYVEQTAVGLSLTASFNLDLFAPERIAGLVEQYTCLLEQIVSGPDTPILQYSLVTETARAALPDPAQPLPLKWPGSFLERFTRHARETPSRIAMKSPEGDWTYQELEARTNRLAHWLRSRGVQHQDVVAIQSPRCAGLVWAVLGVLKAGAAFAIIDPAHPAEWRGDQLRVVPSRGWIHLLAEGEAPLAMAPDCPAILELPAREVVLDGLILPDQPSDAVACAVDPDDIAYLAFTSGTTGKQKVVVSTHRPLAHFLDWHAETWGLAASDRFALLSGLGHDPLLRDMFTPLWLGATLHIPPGEPGEWIGGIARWIREGKVSVLHATPTLVRLLRETADDAWPDLRYVFFGGEPLRDRDVHEMRKLAPTVRCVNYYGATETPQAMGFHLAETEVPAGAPGDGGTIVPLGRGIDGVQLLIFNHADQLAGIGELGEVVVRTPYLSQGYLRRPDLTAERFVTNPVTGRSGDRLYRTGDLGRWRGDGVIEYFGRNDRQVKLRGCRIEPARIEAALATHDEIKEAVVLLNDQPSAEPQLVAYVVHSENSTLDPARLRRYLSEKLPSYMVPSRFAVIPELPVTANGKPDTRLLAAQELTDRRPTSTDRTAPATETERNLERIWSQVLGLDQVGRFDNFFDLGGHSMLAVRLFARVEERFGVRLPLASLFREGTVKDMADMLESRQGSNTRDWIVPLQPEGGQRPLFLIHSVSGNLLFWKPLISQLGPGQPCYGLHPRREGGGAAGFSSLQDMAAAYIEAIRRVQPRGPYSIMGYSFGGKIAYEIARQFTAMGEPVALLGIVDVGIELPRAASLDLIFRYPLAFASNLGRWIRYNILGSSTDVIVKKLRDKASVVARRLGLARLPANLEHLVLDPGNIFGLETMPDWLREDTEANLRLWHAYQPPAAPVRVALFRAGCRHLFSPPVEPDLGWARIALRGVDIEIVSGNHNGIIREPHVRVLAERVRSRLSNTTSIA